jgi:hypothetical protein
MAQSGSMQISDKIGAIFPQYKEEKSQRNQLSGNIGDIISAVIVAKDAEMTTIKTGDDTFLRLSGDKMTANIGDAVYFEIVSLNKKGLALKQIDNPFRKSIQQAAKQTDLLNLKDLMQKSDFVPKEENPLAAETVSEFNHRIASETAEAIKRVKRRLSYTSGGMTQSIIAELTAHGVPLEKISMRVMDAALKEVGDFRSAGETPLRRKEIEATIKKKIKEIGDISNEAAARLIKSGDPITIENIYIAKYSSMSSEETESKETLKALMPIIRKTMAREGIAETPENTESAKFFVRKEIPITKENIEKFNFLKNLESSTDIEVLTEDALAAMQDGRNPFEVEIFGSKTAERVNFSVLKATYDDIVQDLPKITREHVEIALKQAGAIDREITLKHLRDVLHKQQNKEDEPVTVVSPKAENAWQQLNEVRLKLTWDAVVRLADKEIKIDTLSLHETAERLKAIEQKKYTQMLSAVDSPVADGQVEKMAVLFGQIRGFLPLHQGVAPTVMRREISFSIAAVSAENHRLNRVYEFASAQPTAKYGDSVQKVSDQIAPLLEKIGVAASEENLAAARALIKNDLPVTPDHLAEVKLIHGKINEIYDRLNPFIAAEMIKSGLNPSEMKIDQVLAYIDAYSSEQGENSIEKIAKTIRRMEENNALSDKERASVLAIYKMLNQVKKNGAAAMSINAEAHKNGITLGALLSASRSEEHTSELQSPK